MFTDVSLLIPFRAEDPSRFKTLSIVINTFFKYCHGLEIVVIMDKIQPISQIPPSVKIIEKKITHTDLFCKGILYNYGASQTNRKFVWCGDADVIVEPQYALKCLSQPFDVLHPYTGHAFYMEPKVNDMYINSNFDMGVLRTLFPKGPPKMLAGNEYGIYQHLKSPGGSVMFKRNAFEKIGGYHEGFQGWGYEDDEILVRCDKMGLKRTRPTAQNANLWHFYHTKAARGYKNPHYAENQRLFKLTSAGNFSEVKSKKTPVYSV